MINENLIKILKPRKSDIIKIITNAIVSELTRYLCKIDNVIEEIEERLDYKVSELDPKMLDKVRVQVRMGGSDPSTAALVIKHVDLIDISEFPSPIQSDMKTLHQLQMTRIMIRSKIDYPECFKKQINLLLTDLALSKTDITVHGVNSIVSKVVDSITESRW